MQSTLGLNASNHPLLCVLREKRWSILFQLALFALVLLPFGLVVYVPVAYASPHELGSV